MKKIWLVSLFFVWTMAQAAEDLKSFPVFAGTMVEMSWPQVQEAADDRSVVIFPVSVVEEHGPQLDLGPDIYQAAALALGLKRELSKRGVPTVVAPPFFWGVVTTAGTFPGSFSLMPNTVKQVLAEIASNLGNFGFDEIYVVNVHGELAHLKTLEEAAASIRENQNLKFHIVRDLPGVNAPKPQGRGLVQYRPEIHAGAHETKTIRDLFPKSVNVEKARTLRPQTTVSPLGYIGDPASFEQGDGLDLLEQQIAYDAERILSFRKQFATE